MVGMKQDFVYAACGYYYGDTFTTAHVHTFGTFTSREDAHSLVGKLLKHKEFDVQISPHTDSYSSRVGVFWVKKIELNKMYEEPIDMRVPDSK